MVYELPVVLLLFCSSKKNKINRFNIIRNRRRVYVELLVGDYYVSKG